MPHRLAAILAPHLAAIDAALAGAVEAHCAAAPPALVEAIRYSLLAPGKRLRPALTVLACEAVGGDPATALPAAVAVEMVHTYSLIHDDLPAMDDDDLRRGRPTCHRKFGEALAILAGDALLTLAFEVLAASYPAPLAAVNCLELARGAGAAGMVGGQVLDLAAEGKCGVWAVPATLSGLESIHAGKTGALFRAALRMGGLAGGASAGDLAALTEFAAPFGLAFQVADDLLDVSSTEAVAGKRVNKDAGRGKLTYPGLLGIDGSRAQLGRLAADAVAAASKLGPRGDALAELMRAVIDRDR